jgi:uncharacterized protein YbjT (DUF2867 family)
MPPNSKPLVTVVGATSKQGRSVVDSLLQSGRYRVRALTRKTGTSEAQSLAAKGAELIAVDVGRKESLVEAFRGSYGTFLMTPPMAPGSGEVEAGKRQADAALEAGVQHVIFTGLEHVGQITGGMKYAPHFTDKARVEEHLRTLPVISSFIYLAYFYTNFVEYYPPHLDGDTLVFPIYLPRDFRAPFVDPLTATGPAVLEIFDHRDQYAGQTLPVVGELITPQEMVDTFTRVTGRKARYASAVTRGEFLHFFPRFAEDENGLREVLGMVQYTLEHGYYRKERDLSWSRRVDPGVATWEQFLRRTGWRGEARRFNAAAR